MAILGYFLVAVAQVLHIVISFATFLLIARAVLSWVSADPYNSIVQFIVSTTEPLLAPVRAKIPPVGMLDLSVLVVFVALQFLDSFLVNSLSYYGRMFISGVAIGVGV